MLMLPPALFVIELNVLLFEITSIVPELSKVPKTPVVPLYMPPIIWAPLLFVKVSIWPLTDTALLLLLKLAEVGAPTP